MLHHFPPSCTVIITTANITIIHQLDMKHPYITTANIPQQATYYLRTLLLNYHHYIHHITIIHYTLLLDLHILLHYNRHRCILVSCSFFGIYHRYTVTITASLTLTHRAMLRLQAFILLSCTNASTRK